jgi:hypothetical protein
MIALFVAFLAAGMAAPAEPAPAPEQTASITANEALRRYRELTSSLPRCARDTADSDEVIVCAPTPKDRYRAWNGDPVPDPSPVRVARNARFEERSERLFGSQERCPGGQSFGRCGLPEALRGR